MNDSDITVIVRFHPMGSNSDLLNGYEVFKL